MQRLDHPHQCRLLATPWPEVYGVQTESARHFGRHSHATYGIGLLDDGGQVSASGRGQVSAYAGDLITTNPGEVHDGRPLGGRSRRWRIVHASREVIASMTEAGAASAGLALTRPVIQDALLRRALLGLLDRIDRWDTRQQATDTDLLACEESLVQTCGLLLARHATGVQERAVDRDIARVRDRLADEMHRAPPLAQLAAMAELSKYQLLRRFAGAYGMPPHAWLLQRRAERARRLIRDGDSLASAALASGFADQSHMTRAFAQQFGFTPGAWQQAAARQRRRGQPQ
jgi:AraC-like DNA-binding protein